MKVIKNNLYADIKNILEQARNSAIRAVNFSMVIAYWQVGKRIVEEEQGGSKRAAYGENILKDLALQLTQDFGKGLDERELRKIRQFYLLFPIWDSLSPKLTWTHYRHILRVENETAREYYMNEAAEQNWSTRSLERQINSLYYERILSSKNKKALQQHTKIETKKDKPSILDFVKDPYVLEFLNLQPNNALYEKDLETALLNKLQHFLLELGKGFSFVARQKRVSADGEHFYIDLVFYNYILKCFVLIDLKTGKLTHQDIGQMDFYIRYFEEFEKLKKDNPTIGIILCTEKNETIAKYSVLKENKQLFASKYKLYLPSEKELIAELNIELKNIKNK